MKQRVIVLTPELPALQRNAFDRFTGDCLYAKLALQFPVNFWDRSETIHYVSNTTRGEFAVILNLDHRSYEPGSRTLVFESVGDVALALESEPLPIRYCFLFLVTSLLWLCLACLLTVSHSHPFTLITPLPIARSSPSDFPPCGSLTLSSSHPVAVSLPHHLTLQPLNFSSLHAHALVLTK